MEHHLNAYERALLLLCITSLRCASEEEGTAHTLASLVSQSVSLCSREVVAILTCPELVPHDQCGGEQGPEKSYVWKHLQRVLALLYGVAGKTAMGQNKPMLRFDVVLDAWCDQRLLSGEVNEGEPPLQVVLVQPDDREELAKLELGRKQLGLPELPSRCLSPRGGARLPKGFSRFLSTTEHKRQQQLFKRNHKHAAVGGTFDHLHGGHKILLTMAAWVPSERLVCGVTSESMLKSKKYRELLEPEEARLTAARNFLQRIRPQIHYQIEIIDDPCGPTATDGAISALVLSQETLRGGEFVNSERAKRELDPVELYVIDMMGSFEEETARTENDECSAVVDTPHGDKLSSTYIRGWLKSKAKSKN